MNSWDAIGIVTKIQIKEFANKKTGAPFFIGNFRFTYKIGPMWKWFTCKTFSHSVMNILVEGAEIELLNWRPETTSFTNKNMEQKWMVDILVDKITLLSTNEDLRSKVTKEVNKSTLHADNNQKSSYNTSKQEIDDQIVNTDWLENTTASIDKEFETPDLTPEVEVDSEKPMNLDSSVSIHCYGCGLNILTKDAMEVKGKFLCPNCVNIFMNEKDKL